MTTTPPAPSGSAADPDRLEARVSGSGQAAPPRHGAAETARGAMSGGAWTAVSRVTGVVRVVVIGMVLGPTFFGNAYQLTNSLPNLIYYGFLAGSMFSSLLVPALVAHIDTGDRRSTARLAGGFLGIAWCLLLLVGPVAVFTLPHLVGLTSLGADVSTAAQLDVVRLLVVLVMPQVMLYAVAGTGAAVQNAHRRFALAAAAPAVENLGIIALLIVFARTYGTDHAQLSDVGSSPVLLLGLGSTAAVGVHAALQWWGAARTGVTLVPWPRRDDPELRALVRRAVPSLVQAGLLATQTLGLLLVSNRVAGGTVAAQIALNFYYLPIAVVGTPIAIALLPQLSRLRAADQQAEFTSRLSEGLRLMLFVMVPAAVGYLALAEPLARSVSAGQMEAADGSRLIAACLAALCVGLVGQGLFLVATQAAYSRHDTRTPVASMALQVVVCAGLLVLVAVFVRGQATAVAACASFALAAVIGGAHLSTRMFGRPGHGVGLTSTSTRVAVGSAVMGCVAWATAWGAMATVPGRAGWGLAVVCGAVAGAGTYALVQRIMRAAELGWLVDAVRPSRRRQVGGQA